jgi:hypothetical protein
VVAELGFRCQRPRPAIGRLFGLASPAAALRRAIRLAARSRAAEAFPLLSRSAKAGIAEAEYRVARSYLARRAHRVATEPRHGRALLRARGSWPPPPGSAARPSLRVIILGANCTPNPRNYANRLGGSPGPTANQDAGTAEFGKRRSDEVAARA